MLVRCQKFLLNNRELGIVSLNLIITGLSFSLALAFRFDFDLTGRMTLERFWLPLLVLLLCRSAANIIYDLNRGYWRYVSTHEAWILTKAHALSSLGFGTGVMLLRPDGFPRSLILLELALSLVLALGARLLVRLCCERFFSRGLERHFGQECIVLGAGVSGHYLVKTLRTQRHSPYRVIATFDDADAGRRLSVHGVPVVGPTCELRSFLERHPHVGLVLCTPDGVTPEAQSVAMKACQDLDIPFKLFRSFENLFSRELNDSEAPVSVDELLNRNTQFEHRKEIAAVLKDKRILITGAGGSIGSELVRQVLSYDPAEVTLIDKCEYNLYSIEQEVVTLLRDKGNAAPLVSCVLADIVDADRLSTVFDQAHPQIVFHAAAYKHVPLLEDNAYEAFRNNVWGTLELLRACKRSLTDRFIFVSTDKAVKPANVMGCSKRICELLVQQVNSPGSVAAFRSNPQHNLETAVVRFGNVINSAGSVIPLFNKQIRSGGPITVTHEDVERYFMSIREAASLILTAGTLGAQGEIFILDMGKPVKIIRVAEKLRAVHGRRDVPIKITGLRPGEKLTEELYSTFEHRSETRFNKVFMVRTQLQPSLNAFTWARVVTDELDRLSNAQIGSMLKRFVNEENRGTPAENWSEPAAPLQEAV